MYSEILYLFADQALKDRSRFVNKENHPSGESISVKPLSHLMVSSALAYLMQEGYISLQVKQVKKLFLFPGKAVFGKQIKENDGKVTGIEQVLLNNFQKETDVEKAVYYLLDSDESSPWGQVIHLSKESLAQKGLLNVISEKKFILTVKHFEYDREKIQSLFPLYQQVLQQFESFKHSVDMYEVLDKAVKKGLAARVEQSSTDD